MWFKKKTEQVQKPILKTYPPRRDGKFYGEIAVSTAYDGTFNTTAVNWYQWDGKSWVKVLYVLNGIEVEQEDVQDTITSESN